MDLYWKEIPEDLRNLIMERTIEVGNYSYSEFKEKFLVAGESINILELFDWSKTKEGVDFWSKIYRGDFSDHSVSRESLDFYFDFSEKIYPLPPPLVNPALDLRSETAELPLYTKGNGIEVEVKYLSKESFIENMSEININKTKSKSKFKIETI